MRYTFMLTLLVLAGCGRTPVTAPQPQHHYITPQMLAADCPQVERAILIVHGVKGLRDTTLIPAADGESYALPYFHSSICTADVSPGFGCAAFFPYAYWPVVLPGSKYQLSANLACADFFGCSADTPTAFENDGATFGVFWHGVRLAVTNESRNATFKWNGVTLIVNEVIVLPGYVELNAFHFTFPGGGYIKLSHGSEWLCP